MKRIFAIILLILPAMLATAQIQLPPAKWNSNMTLDKALRERQSNRTFSDKKIDEQTISNLLWAANGINRKDGRRTAPSARNCQEIDIYLFTEDYVYLYLPKEHQLKIVLDGDHRSEAAIQPFAQKAPLLLVFVANYEKMGDMDDEARTFYGATDCGFVSQNVYLFCAAEKLNTVVLGMIHRDGIKDLLNINGKAILAQPVGYEQ